MVNLVYGMETQAACTSASLSTSKAGSFHNLAVLLTAILSAMGGIGVCNVPLALDDTQRFFS